MSRPVWDLTSTNSLRGGAEWLRKGADANLVLVVRGLRTVTRSDGAEELQPDVAFAVHSSIAPRDAVEMVYAAMPELIALLTEERERAKEDARLKALREGQAAAGRRIRDEKEGVI